MANQRKQEKAGKRQAAKGSPKPAVKKNQVTKDEKQMRKEDKPKSLEKISLKPATLLTPVPVVLVSCKGIAADSKPNLITLAWAGTICSDPPMISISIRPGRFSHQMVADSGEFVVNVVNEPLLEATDFCGVRSGRDYDKFEYCKLQAVPMEGLAYAPAVAQSPLSLGCKVVAVQHYDSHDVFQGEIVAVTADASLMDAGGRLNIERARLITYVHGEYFSIGKKQGFYGYSVAAPEVLARRMPGKKPRSK
ncbi:MAG: flavin reductase family protein [Saccharofermentanales bacterium]